MKTYYDKNGFEIKADDRVYVPHINSDKHYVDEILETYEDEPNIKLEDGRVFFPCELVITYDSININVTNIEWDTEDGMDGELPELPKNVDIPLDLLVNDYFWDETDDENQVQEHILDYLSDDYGFCVFNYNYEYDHKRKEPEYPMEEKDEKEVWVVMHVYFDRDEEGASCYGVFNSFEKACEKAKTLAENEIKNCPYNEDEITYIPNKSFHHISYEEGTYYDDFKVERAFLED